MRPETENAESPDPWLAELNARGESRPPGFPPFQSGSYLGLVGEGQRQDSASPGLRRGVLVGDIRFLSPQGLVAGTEQEMAQLTIVQLRDATVSGNQPIEIPRYHLRITGPVRFVVKLLTTWELKPEVESACTLLGFESSEATYVRDILEGRATLRGRDVKDRIAHLFRIRTLLSSLFRDDAVENEWLREPRDILNGKAPMELLMEGSMENLLLVREFVELATGR